jgi:hypothetical protein
MTNERINKINITIAELRGWTEIEQYTQAVDGWYGYEPENGPHSQVPNYCKCLNAMHKALMTLNDGERFDFLWHLNDMGIVAGDFEFIIMPPEVLAEAFLRTIGKWEE